MLTSARQRGTVFFTQGLEATVSNNSSMYLSKRQQEVLSMMYDREKKGDDHASLWARAKGRQLHVIVASNEIVLSYVGYRTAYVLEGLGLVATCIDTDLTVGYRLTERGAMLAGLLSGSDAMSAAS